MYVIRQARQLGKNKNQDWYDVLMGKTSTNKTKNLAMHATYSGIDGMVEAWRKVDTLVVEQG